MQQSPRFNAEGLRNLFDVGEGDVPDAAFDCGNVRPVQLALEGEFFLGELSLEPEVADVIGEQSSQGLLDLAEFRPCHSPGHAQEHHPTRGVLPRRLLPRSLLLL